MGKNVSVFSSGPSEICLYYSSDYTAITVFHKLIWHCEVHEDMRGRPGSILKIFNLNLTLRLVAIFTVRSLCHWETTHISENR